MLEEDTYEPRQVTVLLACDRNACRMTSDKIRTVKFGPCDKRGPHENSETLGQDAQGNGVKDKFPGNLGLYWVGLVLASTTNKYEITGSALEGASLFAPRECCRLIKRSLYQVLYFPMNAPPSQHPPPHWEKRYSQAGLANSEGAGKRGTSSRQLWYLPWLFGYWRAEQSS